MDAFDRPVSFIVRLSDPDSLAGTLERVRTGEKRRFAGSQDLLTVLEEAVAAERASGFPPVRRRDAPGLPGVGDGDPAAHPPGGEDQP
jgi:hypothetical protein